MACPTRPGQSIAGPSIIARRRIIATRIIICNHGSSNKNSSNKNYNSSNRNKGHSYPVCSWCDAAWGLNTWLATIKLHRTPIQCPFSFPLSLYSPNIIPIESHYPYLTPRESHYSISFHFLFHYPWSTNSHPMPVQEPLAPDKRILA